MRYNNQLHHGEQGAQLLQGSKFDPASLVRLSFGPLATTTYLCSGAPDESRAFDRGGAPLVPDDMMCMGVSACKWNHMYRYTHVRSGASSWTLAAVGSFDWADATAAEGRDAHDN